MGLTFFYKPGWSMSHRLTRLKPGASPRTHLFFASALWTTIGLILLLRGLVYLKQEEFLVGTLAGFVLGVAKSRFILDKSAIKGVERIKQFGDNTCIGAVYSWRTWLLVMAMMMLGIVLRMSSVPAAVIGILCTAIGCSLVFSSRYGWSQWWNWNR